MKFKTHDTQTVSSEKGTQHGPYRPSQYRESDLLTAYPIPEAAIFSNRQNGNEANRPRMDSEWIPNGNGTDKKTELPSIDPMDP